ncbi:zinc-dependent metalloprotease [Flavivirga spongiicola]|uniref:Zinc-dependent metalloprotease n=1 Tax=Flavivirga spongiicola TaxID=421621 RepID=A0ABU7XRP6_9FLAO|nr:zinc-dependent metalloprotease [Flavivirga sp. MEBiC05379]MDO5978211.1 zinc-dependent metalloprotease [Flavivirga sp. MEBiC05379]
MKKYITFILIYISISSYAQEVNSNIKPYNEVITSEAVTQKGFLQTHLLKNKLYLELPSAMLNKEMLFVRHHRPFYQSQVKWTKRNNAIHLIISEIESKVGNTIPLIKDKLSITITPITFPILALGSNDSSYVIDVTNLFLNTPKPLSARGKVILSDLAFINKVLAFDNTIEVKTNKTFTSKHGPLTEVSDFSLFLLPEPMMPRLYDYRMGFFTDEWNLSRVKGRASIARWRLKKKIKNQLLSDPIKPIVFYFDPITPDKWKPYIKAGIEEWLPAFEVAGFKKAVLVKEPPINDKNFSVNSMRYSFIRWRNGSKYRGYEGKGGGSVHTVIDKRTGEILKGDIIIGRTNSLVDQYFTRCSPLDKRAQQYPFPDDLMGELIQKLTAHEAGHVFGLKDGSYGEYTYPFKKMRDKKWLEEMGHTPSIMNYARENFIVQPQDSIPFQLLKQKVGPTDLYSIRWGYTVFQNINTPDDELPYLEAIIREQDSIPWYRWGGASYGPQATNEVVESDDPVRATALGIENLKRVIKLIPKATRNERNYAILKRLYTKTLDLWVDQMKLVVSLVGGYTAQYKNGNQKGPVYDHSAIPVSRQKEAVAFLIKEAFNPPLWMASPEITRRFETRGTLNNISERQMEVLKNLLLPRRLKNMEEIDLTGEKKGYKMTDFLNDLHTGLWKELEDEIIKINPYRQEIQLTYILVLKGYIEADIKNRYIGSAIHRFNNYTRSNLFNSLINIKSAIKKVIQQDINDVSTSSHLELCLLEINKI